MLPLLRARPAYRAALAAPPPALGLPRAARPVLAAALAAETDRPTLLITARPDRALGLAEALTAWEPGLRVLLFPEPSPMFYEPAAWGAAVTRGRIAALAALAPYAQLTWPAGRPPVIVTSARALITRTLPRREFLTHTRSLHVGQSIALEKLLASWVAIGYAAESVVLEPGQFARRGGIVDIFPPADDQPVRLELFGDEIETLRRFDPATQRSGEKVAGITITPAREALPKHFHPGPQTKSHGENGPVEALDLDLSSLGPAFGGPLEFQIPRLYPPTTLLDYLPTRTQVLAEDWPELTDALQELEEHAQEQRGMQVEAGVIPADFPAPFTPWADLQAGLAQHTPLWLGAADAADVTPVSELGRAFHPGPRFGGQIRPFLEQVEELLFRGSAVVVVSRQAARLAELWSERYAPVAAGAALTEPPAAGTVTFLTGSLAEGWRLDLAADDDPSPPEAQRPASLHLLTDAEVFGLARAQPRRRQHRPAAAPEAHYAQFAPGEFVVHEDFGIGRYRELGKRLVEGLEREYLVLEFAEGDELYVPVYQADRLGKYVGAEDHPPALSRLGSTEWQTAKSRARQAAEEVARELLDLYARRALVNKRAFGPDSPWQAELEGAFPFVETEDQLRAIREVKADLERARPMDRLICGDVGFGKTEVALRAAFKTVVAGYQVAILVPTTVLAQQHFHTFRARLAAYPAKVEMLSRFRTPAESRAILRQLADGQVDIIIGTHRLLQKDIEFKNLGLLIVDEEQRFGVTHKEKLKRRRAEVDVLTLTATPIPRTLYFALTGIRDISTINTPPEERLPVLTHVGAYNEKLVRQAILRELDRGGQIFFVHNRVQSIGLLREKLERLVPEARIGVAHGQMDEHALSHVMDEFEDDQIDLLLCTSIIESGLDIPNANTLIVDRADTFGLAQLYQIRGRVGRSAAQAYAYFFTDKSHRPTPEARERLETLAEQTELGAGYTIAMRDLEMRGAGDIIGPKQSGQITAVGFHLYTRLLGQAVRRLKAQGPRVKDEAGEKPHTPSPTDQTEARELGGGLATTVDLPLAISIPGDYVEDRTLRLQLYQRLANVAEVRDLETLQQELAERFGPLPRPVDNLLYQLRVKLLGVKAGVLAVASENGQLVLVLPALSEAEQAEYTYGLADGARVSKNKIWLPRQPEKEWRTTLVRALEKLAAARAPV
ncbi:MAG: transcription-repair coupling factor [Anaerolineales bacterium]|nr:transcription-repair coupling factor [Anaerolineales bacterium]